MKDRDLLVVLVVLLGAIALWYLSRQQQLSARLARGRVTPLPPTIGPVLGNIGTVVPTIPPLPLGAGGAAPSSTFAGDLGLVVTQIPPLELPWDDTPADWETVGIG